MLEIKEEIVETVSRIEDCRSLNRMEMIGFISCDIMEKSHNEFDIQHFRNIYKGITKGPWTISCKPNTKSIIFLTGDYTIEFTPLDSDGMVIDYYYGEFNYNFYTSIWNIDDIEDALI